MFDDWTSLGPRSRLKHTRHRRAAEYGSSEETNWENEIFLKNVRFVNVNNREIIDQGSFRIVGDASFELEMSECVFSGNSRAVNIELTTAPHATMYIDSSNFTDNVSLGPGAGIHIDQDTGVLDVVIQRCVFESNVAYGMNSIPGGDVMVAISEITGSGGAIAVIVAQSATTTCNIEIARCTFTNNTAENYGGSIYLTMGIIANLIENNFTNIAADNQIRPRAGEHIESRGNVNMRENLFLAQSAVDETPLVSYRADSDGSFMESYDLDFICPKGYRVIPIYSSHQASQTRMSIESLYMYCKSCHDGEYSLDVSEVIVDQTFGLSVTDLTNATCMECPYGAQCNIDVQAKANFWGVEHNDEVHMYLCPQEYCCLNQLCDGYNSCGPYRTGTLCGRCKDGYSESLFSTECIPDEECSYASALWVVVAAYGLAYVLLFVMEGEIQAVLRHFSEMILQKLNRCRLRKNKADGPKTNPNPSQAIPVDEESAQDDVEEGEAAYLQIFMYYVQVPSLLTIDILYHDNREKPLDTITSAVANIVSFNTWGIGLNTCIFPGVTAVFKTWLQIAFVMYLFVSWFIVLLIALPIHLFSGHRILKKSWMSKITMKGRFFAAFVNLMLYTYQYFAEDTFSLLKCVNIAGETDPVLFLDANVYCYQYWQFGFMVFAGTNILPFFIVLSFGPSLLQRRIIKLQTFIFSMMFPLIASPVLVYLFFKNNADSKDKPRTPKPPRQLDNGSTLDGSVVSVVGVVFDPYRHDLFGGLCWEGMITFRRLILVLVATLVPNALLRHFGLVISCFFSLLFHYRTQPFAKKLCNRLETWSLTVLTWVSIVNLIKATYFEAGNIPAGLADDFFYAYDWAETFFLGLVPLIVGLFVGVALFITIVLYLHQKCRPGNKDSGFEPPRRVHFHGSVNTCMTEVSAASSQDINLVVDHVQPSRRLPRIHLDDLETAFHQDGVRTLPYVKREQKPKPEPEPEPDYHEEERYARTITWLDKVESPEEGPPNFLARATAPAQGIQMAAGPNIFSSLWIKFKFKHHIRYRNY